MILITSSGAARVSHSSPHDTVYRGENITFTCHASSPGKNIIDHTMNYMIKINYLLPINIEECIKIYFSGGVKQIAFWKCIAPTNILYYFTGTSCTFSSRQSFIWWCVICYIWWKLYCSGEPAVSEFAWFINDQRLSTVSTQMMIISQISVEQGSVSCRAGNVAGWSEPGHSHLTVNIGPTLTQGGFQKKNSKKLIEFSRSGWVWVGK